MYEGLLAACSMSLARWAERLQWLGPVERNNFSDWVGSVFAADLALKNYDPGYLGSETT